MWRGEILHRQDPSGGWGSVLLFDPGLRELSESGQVRIGRGGEKEGIPVGLSALAADGMEGEVQDSDGRGAGFRTCETVARLEAGAVSGAWEGGNTGVIDVHHGGFIDHGAGTVR